MSNHKDLPPGSQKWASEVDKDRAELLALREVVRRLAENAGIDFANPKRGVNAGNTPSVKSPVGQKLSSLADVATYNVLDGQTLTWNQKGQQWLPVTPTSGGINWRPATENEHMYGDLSIDGAYDSNQVFGQTIPTEDGSANTDSYGLVGTSNGSAYLTAAQRWFGGPTKSHGYVAVHPYYVHIGAAWLADDGSTWTEAGEIEVGRDDIRLATPRYQDSWNGGADGSISMYTNWFFLPRFTTANRPVPPGGGGPYKGTMIFDTTLNRPIFGNGSNWVNALGAAV